MRIELRNLTLTSSRNEQILRINVTVKSNVVALKYQMSLLWEETRKRCMLMKTEMFCIQVSIETKPSKPKSKFGLLTFLVTDLPLLLASVISGDLQQALDVPEQRLGGWHQGVRGGVHGDWGRRACVGCVAHRRWRAGRLQVALVVAQVSSWKEGTY